MYPSLLKALSTGSISCKLLNDTIKFWYTQDIAIIDGPFRPFAIPGLILGYENKYKNIYATKIEFVNSVQNIEAIDKKNKIYTKEEFEKIKKIRNSAKEFNDEKGRLINISPGK